MKILKIIALVIALFFISGCSYKEINDVAIASALGIDWQASKYKIIVEISKVDDGKESPEPVYISADGSTLFECLNNVQRELGASIYFSHLDFAIITDRLPDSVVGDVLEYLNTNNDIRLTTKLLISDYKKLEDVLKAKERAGQVSRNRFSNDSKADNTDFVYDAQLYKIMDNYMGEQPIVYIPIIDSYKNQDEDIRSIKGASVFKDGSTVADIEIKDINLIDLLNGKRRDIYMQTYGQDSYRIVSSNVKRDFYMEDGKLNIDINLTVDINLENSRDLAIMENSIENTRKRIKYGLENDILVMLNGFKSDIGMDIAGFGSMVYKYKPSLYHDIEPDYDRIYDESILNLNVDVVIDSNNFSIIPMNSGV